MKSSKFMLIPQGQLQTTCFYCTVAASKRMFSNQALATSLATSTAKYKAKKTTYKTTTKGLIHNLIALYVVHLIVLYFESKFIIERFRFGFQYLYHYLNLSFSQSDVSCLPD